MDKRKIQGDRGEDAVAEWLAKRGCVILERQFRCRWGEIDLIARTGDGVLCFVEVKTRSARAIAPPRETVTPAKRRKLRDAASWYLACEELDCPCRFDVAEVYPADAGGRRQINYIISAFE